MINTIIPLKNDVVAKAGQLLVLHQDGNVYAVDKSVLDNAVRNPNAVPGVNDLFAEAKFDPKDIERQKAEVIDEMLIRGESPKKVAFAVNDDYKKIGLRRAYLIKIGVISAGKDKTPIKHYWYKSAESLEKAKANANHMRAIRMARRAAKEQAK
jgi:hypothetical protein